MFFFRSKPKPILSDLIPQGYHDIHAHWLPGIDDGAPDPQTSAQLLQQMHSYGFGSYTATPHIFQQVWDNSPASIHQAYTRLLDEQPELAAFSLHTAAEYMLDENVVEQAHDKTLLCLRDRYVLIEFSYMDAPIHWEQLIFEIQLAGYTPVLAHPERYVYWRRHFDNYAKVKDKGCLLQMNLLSSTGYYGPEALDLAGQLLQQGMIDCVGSDIHHQRHIDAFQRPIQVKNVSALEQAFQHPLNQK